MHHQERAAEPGLSDVLLDLAQIAAHFRADIRIGDDRRAALELPVFPRQFMRRRDKHIGMIGLDQLLGAHLVTGIAVAVEEQDRDRFDAEAVELRREGRNFGLVERDVDVAVGQDSLPRLEAQRALDQRLVFLEEQVVGIRPVDAADFVDVPKAFGDDEGGLGTSAFQNSVDGHRRAMEEQPGVRIGGSRMGDGSRDSLNQMMWRRQRLAELDVPGRGIERRHIREGAADVGGEPQARRWRAAPRCPGGWHDGGSDMWRGRPGWGGAAVGTTGRDQGQADQRIETAI